MAEEKKPDPAAQAAQSFSEMVTQWERNFDAFANQVMGTEAYSQAMNDMQKAQLSYQRNMNEFMSQQLASMNMPTREDIIQLMEMVQRLDRRIERIEEKLALNDKPQRSKKRPSRTRQPRAEAAQSQAPAVDDGADKSAGQPADSAANVEQPDTEENNQS